MKQSEAQVTKAITDTLKQLGIWHFKVHIAKNYMGRRGVSDIIGSYRGRFFAIEVKRSDWKPPKRTDKKRWAHYYHQVKFMNEVKIYGKGLAGFATSVNDVISILGVREVTAQRG